MPSILTAPAMQYTRIPTSTQARRQPETRVEIDGHVMAILKGRSEELYEVEEFPTGWEGRAFEVTKDRTRETYNVFVACNDQDHICDCIGFEAHGVCKHVDALKHLIQAGKLEHPMAGSPTAPFPTPEQVAEDAKRADSLPAGHDPFDGVTGLTADDREKLSEMGFAEWAMSGHRVLPQ